MLARHMVAHRCAVLLSTAALIGSCADDARAPSESELQLYRDIDEYLDANARCDSAGDCQNVSTDCFPRMYFQDCCTVYVRHDYDRAALEALEMRTAELALGPGPDGSCGSGCCLGLPATPDCVDGRCAPADP